MAQTNVSRSALNVALARAHLTWLGVVNDAYAQQMLPANRRRVAAALRLPGLRRLARHPTFPYLAARTLFFDRFVGDALHDGLRQIVVIAAGYDSRSWRMACAGVTFFEVDQPATQADKRAKAPEGGPVYVTADHRPPARGRARRSGVPIPGAHRVHRGGPDHTFPQPSGGHHALHRLRATPRARRNDNGLLTRDTSEP
jgi:hypothetical protein